jgi:hypothetical protein
MMVGGVPAIGVRIVIAIRCGNHYWNIDNCRVSDY